MKQPLAMIKITSPFNKYSMDSNGKLTLERSYDTSTKYVYESEDLSSSIRSLCKDSETSFKAFIDNQGEIVTITEEFCPQLDGLAIAGQSSEENYDDI